MKITAEESTLKHLILKRLTNQLNKASEPDFEYGIQVAIDIVNDITPESEPITPAALEREKLLLYKRAMSEYYRMHDYRNMYEYFELHILPELERFADLGHLINGKDNDKG